jgi:hypothetical protein
MTTFAQRLEARLEPWLTPDLSRYIRALGAMFQPILDLAEETGQDGEAGYEPAWGKILDVNLCPPQALGYLAQFVGVSLPTTVTTEEARALIRAEGGFERGTRQSIEAAIERVLGPSVTFTIEERTNLGGEEKAYWFIVIVSPGHASKALNEAIESVKPAGLLFAVVEVEGSWLAGTLAWNEVAEGVQWGTVVEGEY